MLASVQSFPHTPFRTHTNTNSEGDWHDENYLGKLFDLRKEWWSSWVRSDTKRANKQVVMCKNDAKHINKQLVSDVVQK